MLPALESPLSCSLPSTRLPSRPSIWCSMLTWSWYVSNGVRLVAGLEKLGYTLGPLNHLCALTTHQMMIIVIGPPYTRTVQFMPDGLEDRQKPSAQVTTSQTLTPDQSPSSSEASGSAPWEPQTHKPHYLYTCWSGPNSKVQPWIDCRRRRRGWRWGLWKRQRRQQQQWRTARRPRVCRRKQGGSWGCRA